MKKITLLILLSIFVLGLVLPVRAQKNKQVEAADQAFANMMYTTALKNYRKAYSKIKDKDERNRILYQTAECYRIMNNYRMAEPTYRRLLTQKYEEKQPLLLLHLADILRFNRKYEQAIPFYQSFSELQPDDPRGPLGLQSCQLNETLSKTPTRHRITNEKELNSRYDEFSATYANTGYNEILFTSNRNGSTGKGKDEWTQKYFSDLYYVKKDAKGKWTKVTKADEEGIINTAGNEGTPFFNSRFNVMYFTRCATEPKKTNTCRIYSSKRTGKNFSEPVPVDIAIDSIYSIGQPTLSTDELMIIFSSDMPNGKGGRDLWMATRQRKTDGFGRPKNLGDSINTLGDELFPFLRYDTVLYFSSTGHPGLGGLDIFKAYFRTDKEGRKYFTRPIHMGVPLNSNFDDFGIVFHPEAEEEGFFASNRQGGRGSDDIYSFVVEPVVFTLEGLVKDESTLQPIAGALVEMKVSDGSQHKSNTSERGRYFFNQNQVKPNRNFDLSVSKEGYFTKTGSISTIGLESSKDLVLDFVLQPIPRKPIVLPEILYDLGKLDLKPQYQDSLQGLITILEKNPNLEIELAAHTDARDTEEHNDILSQKRAQSVVDYLVQRGIDPDRLTAKGYGERVPRVLTRDIKKAGYTFKAGTRLTESFIDSLPNREVKEAAHQLNRRTEFSITGTNFKSKPKPQGQQFAPKIEIVTTPPKNSVTYILSAKKNRMLIPASIDTYSLEFLYEPNTKYVSISMDAALDLLKQNIITKDDFQGNPEEIISEGQIKRGSVLTLPSLRIGRKMIYDVDVIVEPKQDEKLILNNEILSRFGAFTINEDTREIIFE